MRQKNQNRRKLKYLPDPEPLGARPKTPCKRMFFRIAKFIADQRGKGKLNSECDMFGIYRSDAYAAATFLYGKLIYQINSSKCYLPQRYVKSLPLLDMAKQAI